MGPSHSHIILTTNVIIIHCYPVWSKMVRCGPIRYFDRSSSRPHRNRRPRPKL